MRSVAFRYVTDASQAFANYSLWEIRMDMSMMMTTEMTNGMDMTAMQNLMEACSACEQACTMCASNCMGMPGMEKCAAMCMNCADMAHTMMRMMMRPAAMDMGSMMAMLQACLTMATACATECGSHAEMSEHCAMCATACQQMATACEAMVASMPAGTSWSM